MGLIVGLAGLVRGVLAVQAGQFTSYQQPGSGDRLGIGGLARGVEAGFDSVEWLRYTFRYYLALVLGMFSFCMDAKWTGRSPKNQMVR